MKHTPGPWESGSKVAPDGYGSIVWSPECGTICSLTDEMVHHRENAALIASAPDLLYVAIAALDCLTRPNTERDENRVRVMLDSAIARAEGR